MLLHRAYHVVNPKFQVDIDDRTDGNSDKCTLLLTSYLCAHSLSESNGNEKIM